MNRITQLVHFAPLSPYTTESPGDLVRSGCLIHERYNKRERAHPRWITGRWKIYARPLQRRSRECNENINENPREAYVRR